VCCLFSKTLRTKPSIIFDSHIDYLSTSLTVLYLSHFFNQPINYLSSLLCTLIFGKHFNQPIDHLPQSIHSLTFRFYFDQKVDYLFQHLHTLGFDYLFNQPIDHLPPHLLKLTLHRKFNQPLGYLSMSLQKLTFNYSDFNKSLDFLPLVFLHLKAIPPPEFYYECHPLKPVQNTVVNLILSTNTSAVIPTTTTVPGQFD
jgi:hypothetical protein